MLPLAVGYAPFALLVGAAVAESDNPAAAWLATWTIYGGAAHLAVLDVLRDGAGPTAAVAVGLMINVRLAAYSAAMAPDWRDVPARGRLVAALALTDAPWAIGRADDGDAADRRGRFVGAALLLWFAWPMLVSLGVLVGPVLRDVTVAALLPGLMLGFLVVSQLRHRTGRAVLGAAVVTAVACAALPTGLALLASGTAAAVAGSLVHRSEP